MPSHSTSSFPHKNDSTDDHSFWNDFQISPLRANVSQTSMDLAYVQDIVDLQLEFNEVVGDLATNIVAKNQNNIAFMEENNAISGIAVGSISNNVLLGRNRIKNSFRNPNTITKEEMLQYLHLQQPDAAKKLLISSSTLRRVCRKLGISEWPYKKLRTLERLAKNVKGNTDHREIINELENQREQMLKDPVSTENSNNVIGSC
nr:predicted protein [Ipomoea batatas]